MYDLSFLDENKGWAVGSQGTIIHTIDGGETWELQAQGLTSNFLRCVHFTSPNNGYIVDNGKTLLKYGEILGIGKEPEDLLFTIFPNPAKGKFGVQSLEFGVANATIELFDLNGRKLLEKQIPKGSETVEVDCEQFGKWDLFLPLDFRKQKFNPKTHYSKMKHSVISTAGRNPLGKHHCPLEISRRFASLPDGQESCYAIS